MAEIEDSPLLVIKNTNGLKSEKETELAPYITSKGKVVAFRSDDAKAWEIYGQLGEAVPATEAGLDTDFEVRDHRQDEEQHTDLVDSEEPAA